MMSVASLNFSRPFVRLYLCSYFALCNFGNKDLCAVLAAVVLRVTALVQILHVNEITGKLKDIVILRENNEQDQGGKKKRSQA
jgi:hypothetical protein